MLKLIVCFSAFLGIISCNSNNTNESPQTMDNKASTNWIKTTNIYEVNVRQYTKEGTFNAFIPHLPRLKEMGVKTLWFMPITPIAQKNKKGTLGSPYAASDYTSINPEFGTLEDFKNLVKTAQSQGFKVIIDWVANHTGWDHKWTKDHPDWFLKDSATNDFKMASGMEDIIELDFKNKNMRRAMIDAMKFWVKETGIDGFRADLAFWVELDFWVEAKAELEKVKPLFWLGELDPLEKPEYMQVFDAAYTWTWMHKTREFYEKGLPVLALDTVLQKYVAAPGIKAWFTTNHDENSWNGTEYEKYGDAAKALAVFSCTWKGLPLIYSGQELPNKKRLEFFEKDTIEWNNQYELESCFKNIFKLKYKQPAVNYEAVVQRLEKKSKENVLAYLRKSGDREVLVILNLSKNDNLKFSILDPNVKGRFVNSFSKAESDFNSGKDFIMQAWEFQVFEK
jgi:glycosidase